MKKKGWTGLAMGLAILFSGWSAAAAGGVDAAFALGASARSLGVGGARAAFSDPAAATALNPAALAWAGSLGASSLYVEQFGGVSYGAAALSAPYMGISAFFVDSGWIASGAGGFRYTSQGFSCAGAAAIGRVALGARWRFLHSGTPFAGHGWAADGALLVDLGAVRVGSIWDAVLSSPMTYEGGESEAWDDGLVVGAAVTLEPFDEVVCTVTADIDGLLDGAWRLLGGLEAWVGPLAARLGWDGRGPTFGLSVQVGGVGVDWSLAARSDLGTSHRVSLEVLF